MKTFFAIIGFIGVAIVAVFVVLVAAGTSKVRSDPSDSTTSLSDSGSSQSSSEVKRVAIGNATYPSTAVSNVTVTLLRAQAIPGFLNSYEVVRPDAGQFIAIRVAITNQQRDEITMSMSLFKLLTPDGVEYSASEKSLQISNEQSLFLKNINPGLTKTGDVLFEVPTGINLRSMRLVFRGGMTGGEATLPLSEVGVQIAEPSAPAMVETSQTADSTSANIDPAASNAEPEQKPSPESQAAPIVRQDPPVSTVGSQTQ